MFTFKEHAAILVAPALLALSGCHNNMARHRIPPRQVTTRAWSPAQIFLDGTELRNDVAAETPSVFRDQAGLLHVTVPIRSVINKQLYIEYQAIFFDRDHQEVDRSPWSDKTLAAMVPDNVTIVSSSPQAEFFQVHFRYPPMTGF